MLMLISFVEYMSLLFFFFLLTVAVQYYYHLIQHWVSTKRIIIYKILMDSKPFQRKEPVSQFLTRLLFKASVSLWKSCIIKLCSPDVDAKLKIITWVLFSVLMTSGLLFIWIDFNKKNMMVIGGISNNLDQVNLKLLMLLFWSLLDDSYEN